MAWSRKRIGGSRVACASPVPDEALLNLSDEQLSAASEILKEAETKLRAILESPTPVARTTISSKGGGAEPVGMPPCDAQSFAQRSGEGTQDLAAGQPATLGEDSAARPPDLPSGDDGPHVTSRKFQQPSVQQVQPIAPVFKRDAGRTLGSWDCQLHSSTQPCKKCGARAKPVHMITRLSSGLFCEKCRPACHPTG